MPKGQNARPFLFTKIIEECYNKIGGANMLIKTERKPLDFSVFPQVIRDMSEDNSNASAIIDNLIDLKGESNSLATLILLDDMNIRGIQIYILYKLCGENIDIFYNKITDITKKDIDSLNKNSAHLCTYKAVFEGTSEDRMTNPQKYIFTEEERKEYFVKSNDQKDLYPSITKDEALKIIKDNGFTCGYKLECINDHYEETYRVFYNDLGDILYIVSLDSPNIFLWKDSKLNAIRKKTDRNIDYVIDLKDHPFKTYRKLKMKNLENINDINLLPIIKTKKSIEYLNKNSRYSSCVIASIYDLLSFNKTYKELDNGLKKIYKPLLENFENKAYDEIIKYLYTEDGLDIANGLQNVLGYNLSKQKLLDAKDRYCKSHGHEVFSHTKRFMSKLFTEDPYTKNINNKIINVLKHDIIKETEIN